MILTYHNKRSFALTNPSSGPFLQNSGSWKWIHCKAMQEPERTTLTLESQSAQQYVHFRTLREGFCMMQKADAKCWLYPMKLQKLDQVSFIHLLRQKRSHILLIYGVINGREIVFLMFYISFCSNIWTQDHWNYKGKVEPGSKNSSSRWSWQNLQEEFQC